MQSRDLYIKVYLQRMRLQSVVVWVFALSNLLGKPRQIAIAEPPQLTGQAYLPKKCHESCLSGDVLPQNRSMRQAWDCWRRLDSRRASSRRGFMNGLLMEAWLRVNCSIGIWNNPSSNC